MEAEARHARFPPLPLIGPLFMSIDLKPNISPRLGDDPASPHKNGLGIMRLMPSSA